MPGSFELFVCNIYIGSRFVTQVQVIDKGKAGVKQLLFEVFLAVKGYITKWDF